MKFFLKPFPVNLLLLGLIFLLSVGIGSVFIPPGSTIQILFGKLLNLPAEWSEQQETILLAIRLPHVVLMALVGSALAGSGAAYQGLFRNPLADPYLMGVASGAGLGAVLGMALTSPGEWGWLKGELSLYTIPLFAFVGALMTVLIVYTLSTMGGTSTISNFILAGVAVGAFATALSTYLMLRSQGELRRAVMWLMGGATVSGWDPVLVILPYVFIGLVILAFSGHALNVLQFGEEQAQQLGLNVRRARFLLIGAASLATAAAVAFTGLIGFIGLMIPHIIRLVWGADHRRLIILSIIAGASGLMLADMLARMLLPTAPLPVGVITALVGAPFFLWILLRTRSRSEG